MSPNPAKKNRLAATERSLSHENEVMKKAVMCIVHTHDLAESILKQLHEAGFPGESVSVLFPARQAKAGPSTGALGLLAGIDALALPGLGPFMATGPILATLLATTTGAPAGELTPGLVGMGVPEADAYRYEEHAKNGRILISVHTDSLQAQKRAEYIFRASQGENVCTTIDTSMQRKREVRSDM